jgi:hypothetical protein
MFINMSRLTMPVWFLHTLSDAPFGRNNVSFWASRCLIFEIKKLVTLPELSLQ